MLSGKAGLKMGKGGGVREEGGKWTAGWEGRKKRKKIVIGSFFFCHEAMKADVKA